MVILRTKLNVDHYVLVVNYDQDNYYLWDSYYLEKYPNITIVNNQEYNRIIPKNIFISETNVDYALGELKKREAVLIISR